jgi:hypothetical protein
VPEGDWGGVNLALSVHSTGADVGLDCAHGAITVPLVVEADGRFSWPGYFVHDVGPTLDPEVRRPASYSGTYDGRGLTLTVAVQDGGSAGPFTATLGGVAELQQCR